MAKTLVLASASPARLSTLRSAGIEPRVIPSEQSESVPAGLTPVQTVQELAARKANAVADRLRYSEPSSVDLVLGCDSVLELDGETVGKPGTAQRARERWLLMRGRTATLHSGHYVVDLSTGSSRSGVASVPVTFAQVSDAEIDAYVATGEPLHVAGGFTIDGLGGAFVEHIAGDPHAVVGVSLPLLRHLLADLAVPWTQLWPAAPTAPPSPSPSR